VSVDFLQRKVYNRRKPKQEHIVLKTRIAALIGTLFPAIQGQTPVIADNGSMPDQVSLINALISVNPWPATAYNVAANTTAFTATQQQVFAAEQTYLLITSLAGGAAVTLPTVATLLSTMTLQQAVVGSTVTLRVLNTSGQTATITTNTGWTLTGHVAILTATFVDYVLQITAVGATPTATLQSVGAGDAP
jgi:hypothetical protein